MTSFSLQPASLSFYFKSDVCKQSMTISDIDQQDERTAVVIETLQHTRPFLSVFSILIREAHCSTSSEFWHAFPRRVSL